MGVAYMRRHIVMCHVVLCHVMCQCDELYENVCVIIFLVTGGQHEMIDVTSECDI